MKIQLKSLVAASLVAIGFSAAAPANAATIQLGFILDRSGSIGAANWTTITSGLASAVNLIPVAGPDTYEVSVVTFATSATANITNFLVTDTTTRSALSTSISSLAFTGGSTDFAAAFATMQTALFPVNGTAAAFSYVNFATDGVPNDNTAGIAARNALITAGVDNISIEGIGAGVNASALQTSYCYPGPCDTTSPYNFPTQGFYIGVADAAGYAAAIGNKVRIVTNQTVPEPATMALLGIGLLGIGFSRRRST